MSQERHKSFHFQYSVLCNGLHCREKRDHQSSVTIVQFTIYMCWLLWVIQFPTDTLMLST